MFPKTEVYEGTVHWKQYHRTTNCTPFDAGILTLPAWEIYFPKYTRNILIKGDLSIGEYSFSDSVIIVEGSVRCYQKAFISQLSTKKDFIAPQGNISSMFIDARGNITLGLRCNVGIVKSDADVTIGRNSAVQIVIGNNVTIHQGTTVGCVYARGTVRIPCEFPVDKILEYERIEYI